jgi:1-acyl-sn-glycerol-3-phosphate acyltransferase
MRWSVSRGWRLFATAFGFASAGVMSLILALVVLPLLGLLSGSPEEKEIRAQRAVHWFVRAFLRGIIMLGVMRLRCTGSERLREPGTLVVANHPTLIDALALMSLMPQADCVVKESYYENAFLGGSAKGAGFIPNRDGPGLVSECADRLLRGRSLIIFPEGTRSPVNELGPFARGAAHIALRAGCNPVPVTIQCEPATLHRDQVWWEVPERPFTLTLVVGEPLQVKESVDQQMSRGRAARALTASLREHFERRLAVV